MAACHEIDVKQNTQPWKQARKGPLDVRIGGSGMGAAAGVNPHCSRSKYFMNQVFGEPEEKEERVKAAFEHGHFCEPYNAVLYEKWTGNKVRECGVHVPDPKHNKLFQENDELYFAVSCDRVGDEMDLECKCPVSPNSFQQYYVDRICPSYLAQTHLQMAVRGRRKIHFMVTLYARRGNSVTLKKAILYEIKFSMAFWKFIYERARALAELLWSVASGLEEVADVWEELDIDTDIKDIPSVEYTVIRKYNCGSK